MVTGLASRSRRLARHAAGVTVLELLVVVAVSAILAAVAIPTYSTATTKQRVKQAAIELHLALVSTRSEALRRNTNVTMTPVNASNWEQGWQITDGAGNVLQRQGTMPKVHIAVSPSSATLVYKVSGRTSATSTQTFTVTMPGTACTYTVRVDTGGRPYVGKTGC